MFMCLYVYVYWYITLQGQVRQVILLAPGRWESFRETSFGVDRTPYREGPRKSESRGHTNCIK